MVYAAEVYLRQYPLFLKLKFLRHDLAERIHEIAQLVYDSYIRRTRSVHGLDDFGLDE